MKILSKRAKAKAQDFWKWSPEAEEHAKKFIKWLNEPEPLADIMEIDAIIYPERDHEDHF